LVDCRDEILLLVLPLLLVIALLEFGYLNPRDASFSAMASRGF
jgi:hypothetical protein